MSRQDGIHRVSSTASELNDFTEAKDGKGKLYNVSGTISSFFCPFPLVCFLIIRRIFLGLKIPLTESRRLVQCHWSLPSCSMASSRGYTVNASWLDTL